jgi:hypothetical protein
MFCKLINKFGNFHVENKIFLNIPKDYLFSFTKVFLLKNIKLKITTFLQIIL